MKFMSMMTNELPFMLELPNGIYKVKTTYGLIDIDINSDMYNLYIARFPEFSGKQKYVGEKDELQKIITNKNIPNYAFGDCKTFVGYRCYSEKEFTDAEYAGLSEEQCVEKIKSNLIQQGVKYSDTEDLAVKSNECFTQSSAEDIFSLKQQILIEQEFIKLHNVYAYYEALNKIIRQYSYLRKHFWVHKIDENILEGTLVQDYLDGRFYSTVTYAGLAPSILPSKKKYPEISNEDKSVLDNNLANDFQLPIEDELILVARSLWFRLEYRSAMIESSAALEVVVEKKLVEKMKSQGKDDNFIEDELKKTETNFHQRCDVFLKRYTGKSFVNDNSELWQTIDQHRKNYRHKIAHSSINPDRATTETIINDFEKAIQYISAL